MQEQQVSTLSKRGLRPVRQLAADRPHGDRLRYMAGCRCAACRRANADYQAARKKARDAGDWNGIVSAERARSHMKRLSLQGVGRNSVAAATDISDGILFEIVSGKRLNIRARTERKILAVTKDAAADRALIDAGPTWALIDELTSAGFTHRRLASELGRKSTLQIGKDQVTVRNAYLIERLHTRLMASDDGLVDSKAASRLVVELRAELYTARQIAAELGLPAPTGNDEIQLKKRITRRLEKAIAALHERWME